MVGKLVMEKWLICVPYDDGMLQSPINSAFYRNVCALARACTFAECKSEKFGQKSGILNMLLIPTEIPAVRCDCFVFVRNFNIAVCRENVCVNLFVRYC